MTVEFKISYTEKDNVSKMMEEIYYEELSKLEPINEGDVNISSMYIYDLGDKLEAKVIIRNALSKSLSLDMTPLIITDDKDSIILEEIVDLNDLGVIPSNNARPYSILFNKANLKKEVDNFESCKVIFNNNVKAINTKKIESVEIDETISMINSHQIKEYIHMLPPIKSGDVKITGYKAFLDESGKENFIVLMINANDKSVKIQNFTVGLKNSLGLIAAMEPVRDEYEVPPFTAKAVKIPLNKENIISEDYTVNTSELFIQPSV